MRYERHRHNLLPDSAAYVKGDRASQSRSARASGALPQAPEEIRLGRRACLPACLPACLQYRLRTSGLVSYISSPFCLLAGWLAMWKRLVPEDP